MNDQYEGCKRKNDELVKYLHEKVEGREEAKEIERVNEEANWDDDLLDEDPMNILKRSEFHYSAFVQKREQAI